MFGGGLHKRGSLRKVLGKRHKSDSISAPGSAHEQQQLQQRQKALAPTIVEPSVQTTSRNAADGRVPDTSTPGNPPHGSTNWPLTVDVNCVCPTSGDRELNSADSVGRSHRIFAPQLSGPAEMCRVHGPEQQHHHRSISASPQYYSAMASARTVRSGEGQLSVPLLIPLGGTHAIPRRGALRGITQHNRMSLNSGGPPSASARPSSTNIYLATLDHPTVFDFEDWHTSLDQKSQEAVYQLFMKAHKCYDLIPTSSKLVVFDTELPVSKAFFALVYNGVRAAPLYDNNLQEFVGMLTITDWVGILHKYYTRDPLGEGMKELEEHKISTWRDIFKADGRLKPFTTIDPSESLYKAVQLLIDSKIHRLPVLEESSGNILYILTHKRLIKFLFLYINDLPRPSYLSKRPKELGIGTWGNICTISKDTPLIEAMKIFLSKRVSALPLLDSDGKVVDVYAKFDAINLAADKTYTNLDTTVYEALQHRSDWFEGVRKCSDEDSLLEVIESIVKAEVHRLIVTDNCQRVVGIISLSDILKFLVLAPPSPDAGEENPTLVPVFTVAASEASLFPAQTNQDDSSAPSAIIDEQQQQAKDNASNREQ